MGNASSIKVASVMGVTIELQNLGDAQVCRELMANLEHAFSGRSGEWRASLTGSRASEAWDLLNDPTGLSVHISSQHLPVSTSINEFFAQHGINPLTPSRPSRATLGCYDVCSSR